MSGLGVCEANDGWQSAWTTALLDPAAAPPRGVDGPGAVRGLLGLSVHRNNVVAGLVDVLASTFDVVQQLVGRDFFRAMAARFVRVSPPDSPVLLAYGARLPDFIRQFGPATAVPYLADVAQLEWLLQTCLHAADHHGADALARLRPAHVLAASDPHLLGTGALLHPSLAGLSTRTAAVSIWAAHQSADDAPKLDEIDWQQGEQTLIWRPDDQAQLLPVAPAVLCFVQALQRGHSLAEAAGLTAEMSPDFDAIGTLAWLRGQGLLVGLTTLS